MTETKRSFCRICIANCGTLIRVEGDTVVEVRGDPDHPLSRGYLCPKGRALGTFQHDPQRLSSAAIRRDGALEDHSYDETLASAVTVLQRVIDQHGSGTIGLFMGSGGFIDPAATLVLRKLRQQLRTDHNYTTATVDSISKVVVCALMAGTTALVPHLDDLGTLVLLVGCNPLVSHGQSTGFPNPMEWVRAARARGEVYVIDPRRTETAMQASEHVGLRPGTDHALLAHLVREVIERRQLTADTLPQPTEGFDALNAAVAPYDEQLTAAVTGVSPDQLQRLRASVARAGRLAVVTGTGTSMSVPGNLTEWMAWSLMIVTGSLDEPGGMWFNPGYFTRLDDRPVLPAVAPNLPAPTARPSVRNVSGEWPASLIPEEIEAGRLRALVVVGASILTALPETDRLRKALDQLDALVILDVIDNDNLAHASHVFAVQAQLERADLPSLDMYASARYSQYTAPVVNPPEGRVAAWRVLADVARGLGLDAIGRGADPAEVTADDLLGRVARGRDLAELRAREGAAHVDDEAVYQWAVSRLPRGAWDVAPEELVAQLRAQVEMDRAGPGDALRLIPRRQLRRENARAFREGEHPELMIHAEDAAARGIENGATVMVSAEVGTIATVARVNDAIAKGAVSLPHGHFDTNVNVLISADDLDPISGMARMSGTLVSVAAARPT